MAWFGNLSANRKINQKIEDLEDRCRRLERLLENQDLEFSSLYGKVRTALARTEKRARIAEATEQPPDGSEGAAPLDPSDGLSPNQRKINQSILALREKRWRDA